MTREEIVSLRQRLLDRQFQPISVYNWDYPNIPEKDRGKRPSETELAEHSRNAGLSRRCAEHRHSDRNSLSRSTSISKIQRSSTRSSRWPRSSSAGRLFAADRTLPADSCRIGSRTSDARKIIISLSCGKLEFLGRGQQFVGFGKHPSGADYEWQGQPLDEIEIDALPVIDDAGIRALAAWAEERWPVAEKAKPNGDGRKSGGKADFRNTRLKEDVEAALKQLPCDYDRETWVKLGMAYRAGSGSYARVPRMVAPASAIRV